MKNSILVLALFCISTLTSFAQCDEHLLDKAKQKLSEKEVLLKDYKVKLGTATIDQPSPVAEFSQPFETGKTYRLRIISDTEDLGAQGILRLFEGNNYLGSSFLERTNRHFKWFDFKCQKTGNYKILVTFQDGKAGCAIVLISVLP